MILRLPRNRLLVGGPTEIRLLVVSVRANKALHRTLRAGELGTLGRWC